MKNVSFSVICCLQLRKEARIFYSTTARLAAQGVYSANMVVDG